MTTKAATTTTGAELRARLITEAREIVKQRDKDKFRLGDIILELAPIDSPPGTLTTVADELSINLQYCAMLRSVSYKFPPSERTHDVPWFAYKDTVNCGEFREEILRLVAESLIASEAGGRRLSAQQLVTDKKREVLAAAALPAPPRQSGTRKLADRIARYRSDFTRGRVSGDSLQDFKALQVELRSLSRELQPWLRGR